MLCLASHDELFRRRGGREEGGRRGRREERKEGGARNGREEWVCYSQALVDHYLHFRKTNMVFLPLVGSSLIRNHVHQVAVMPPSGESAVVTSLIFLHDVRFCSLVQSLEGRGRGRELLSLTCEQSMLDSESLSLTQAVSS